MLPSNAFLQRVSGREVLRRHLPSTSRAAPALVILNWSLGTGLQIVGTGFIARQQAENYHWKQLIADPSSFRLNTKRHGRSHGRLHGMSDGRLIFVKTNDTQCFTNITGGVLQKICQPIAGLRGERIKEGRRCACAPPVIISLY